MATTLEPNLPALSLLILVRLLAAREKGDTLAKIKKDLEPLLVHRWAGAVLTERIEQALTELESNGLVTVIRGRRNWQVSKVVATTAGRQWGLRFLGVAQLRPKTTWGVLKKTY